MCCSGLNFHQQLMGVDVDFFFLSRWLVSHVMSSLQIEFTDSTKKKTWYFVRKMFSFCCFVVHFIVLVIYSGISLKTGSSSLAQKKKTLVLRCPLYKELFQWNAWNLLVEKQLSAIQAADSRYFVTLSGYPEFLDFSKSYPDFSRNFPDFDNF